LKSDENSKAALNADLDLLKAIIHDRELKKPENWACVERAKFLYSAGFFLTV
jgi:hypothetical protein